MVKFDLSNIQQSTNNIQFSMKQLILVAGCWLLVSGSNAQTITPKLQKVFSAFEKDSQLKNAISSLYVIDANTRQVVFDKNSRIGLAPASTQKIITSVTAFELLGKEYSYKTSVYLNGTLKKDTLQGDLIIKGSGDPTFGSWRYSDTKRENLLASIEKLLATPKIKFITGDCILDERSFDTNTIPDGWIWQDIGNYYGAGAGAFNWNENQYDLILKPGVKENDEVQIIKTEPGQQLYSLINELKTGHKGSGDNGFIYVAPYTVNGFVRGTIPLGQKEFSISGSMPMPSLQFLDELQKKFDESHLEIGGKFTTSFEYNLNKRLLHYGNVPLGSFISPTLDSIIYWFNKKSINLYGEALIKTFAFEKKGIGSTDSGVAIVRDFWKQKGLDPDEISIVDGSGLSPLNRITTHSQVEILKYAKTKDWFPYFFNSLPEYNGMVMKSGTIRGVKGFCGYQKAKNGKEYIFSFLVNNYNGSPDALIKKMYNVLDSLK